LDVLSTGRQGGEPEINRDCQYFTTIFLLQHVQDIGTVFTTREPDHSIIGEPAAPGIDMTSENLPPVVEIAQLGLDAVIIPAVIAHAVIIQPGNLPTGWQPTACAVLFQDKVPPTRYLKVTVMG
jgi:hypothetical protein